MLNFIQVKTVYYAFNNFNLFLDNSVILARIQKPFKVQFFPGSKPHSIDQNRIQSRPA